MEDMQPKGKKKVNKQGKKVNKRLTRVRSLWLRSAVAKLFPVTMVT
jgi:hypothetical protein